MKRLVVLASGAIALAIAAACSSPDENARVNPDVGLKQVADTDPPFSAFDQLSAALVYHCGTIDCHGDRYRSLRFYGYGGMRLMAGAKPDDDQFIVEAEEQKNYESIIGLEPEKFAEVIAEGGREPERLSLVAKPRALQNHKGGPVMKPGDPIDDCITAWLRKDAAAMATPCRQANVLRLNRL